MAAIIYNATDGPLIIDRAGRTLGAREHSDDELDVETQPVKGHIDAGRAVVAETPAPAKGSRNQQTKEA